MNVARTINAWVKYRRTMNELSRMSARELRDIGVSPSDIQRVAKGGLL